MKKLITKRPKILTELMIERRIRAEALIGLRRRARQYGIPPSKRNAFSCYTMTLKIPRVTVKSLLRLAAQCRSFAHTRWTSHDTEYYSACGWDDYQLDLRGESLRKAFEYSKAARFIHQKEKTQ